MKTLALIIVFFEFITSDPAFLSKTPCTGTVTVVSTAAPGSYDREIKYICGDVFGCRQRNCYAGEGFSYVSDEECNLE